VPWPSVECHAWHRFSVRGLASSHKIPLVYFHCIPDVKCVLEQPAVSQTKTLHEQAVTIRKQGAIVRKSRLRVAQAKQKPLMIAHKRLSVGARGFEPAIPTEMHHIYPAYSFSFFIKGLCATIGGPAVGFRRVVKCSGATSPATRC
jgi:hypothetical protein